MEQWMAAEKAEFGQWLLEPIRRAGPGKSHSFSVSRLGEDSTAKHPPTSNVIEDRDVE
jgi:hypothetical protein